jgi:uncharacterized membrane protein
MKTFQIKHKKLKGLHLVRSTFIHNVLARNENTDAISAIQSIHSPHFDFSSLKCY